MNKGVNLVSRTDFARMAGVAKASIFSAVKVGRLPTRGREKYIDILCPEARKYLKLHSGAGRLSDKPDDSPNSAVEAVTFDLLSGDLGMLRHQYGNKIPDDIQEIRQWTLDRVVATFGTGPQFKAWADAYKKIVDTAAKDIDIGIKQGQLLNRAALPVMLWSPLKKLFLHLLGDTARTLARLLHTKIKAGATPEECEGVIHDRIGKEIRNFQKSTAKIRDGVALTDGDR